uniref:Peroxisomal testis enriched protein 1 n=1 Tax=Canis lupus familiaris TaxID=9615 RepID=A0A8C0Z1Z0_CANLF
MKKKHDTIVCEPKELLNPSPKVTNCCKSLWVKYSFQKEYMTRLVSSQPVSAMSRNPDHSLPSQPKESSIGQNHHQEEIIHKLAMQLRNTGDSIDRRMVQEALILKNDIFWDPWVAQRFGACLWPRARSWRPGIDSHVGLPVHGACFSLPVSLPLFLSL